MELQQWIAVIFCMRLQRRLSGSASTATSKVLTASERIQQLATANNPLEGWWAFLSLQLDCLKGPCKHLQQHYRVATEKLDQDGLYKNEHYAQIWMEYARLLK